MWNILEEVKQNKRLMVKVQCDCGSIELRRKDHVESGRTKGCKSCSAKQTAKQYPPPVNVTGYGLLSGTHYSAISSGAKRRGISFEVSAKYLWELFLKQQGLCALTDIPITLIRAIKNNNVDWEVITASLDRIDSDLGYVEGNVWWVHKEINRLKNNYTMQELLFWSKLLLDKHGNPELSTVNEIDVAVKVQRLDGEDSTNNPSTSAQHPAMDEDIV